MSFSSKLNHQFNYQFNQKHIQRTVTTLPSSNPKQLPALLCLLVSLLISLLICLQAPKRLVETRKFDVVIRGIKECPKGTHWRERATSDDKSAFNTLSKIVPSLSIISLRDSRRLGRYSGSNSFPRPLLVTLSRASEVVEILSRRNSLADEKIYIKPYLSLEEKHAESVLLKERRSLIDSGINRKLIRLRGSNLFIGQRHYGRVANGTFTQHLSLEDLAPHMAAISSQGSSNQCTYNSHTGTHQITDRPTSGDSSVAPNNRIVQDHSNHSNDQALHATTSTISTRAATTNTCK